MVRNDKDAGYTKMSQKGMIRGKMEESSEIQARERDEEGIGKTEREDNAGFVDGR